MATSGPTAGAVTFPNVHAACAVLLSWAALCRCGVFPVSAILNTVMAISAMSDVDPLAGLATTGLAIGLSWPCGRYSRATSSRPEAVRRRHGGHRWPGNGTRAVAEW